MKGVPEGILNIKDSDNQRGLFMRKYGFGN